MFTDRNSHMADAMLYAFSGMKLHIDPGMSDTYTEKAVYRGHPLTQWLARWLNFDPDVHVVYIRHRPKRQALRVGNHLFMHPAMHRALVDATTS